MKKKLEERNTGNEVLGILDVQTAKITQVAADTVIAPAQITSLNYQAALSGFSEKEQQEIIALSQSIDVTETDKILSYGSNALQQTFAQCGEFLKDESGTQADQEIIAQVVALSKKAQESYDDFNLAIKEPNAFQKFLMMISAKRREIQNQRIHSCAVTNYNLLMELRNSCEEWLKMLQNAMYNISKSAINDSESAELLEKYIIAGRMAQERIWVEMELLQTQYLETGLQKYSREYEELKQGYDILEVKLANLESSRTAYYLSMGQLALIKRSNRNVQISIHTQIDSSMALMGQQLRNAVLNAKSREVMEGQKAVSKLNEALMMQISEDIGLTAEETEKIAFSGFYDVEAAKKAVQSVITSCDAIQNIAEEMLPKLKADTTQIASLIDQLEPYVNSVEIPDTSDLETEETENLDF